MSFLGISDSINTWISISWTGLLLGGWRLHKCIVCKGTLYIALVLIWCYRFLWWLGTSLCDEHFKLFFIQPWEDGSNCHFTGGRQIQQLRTEWWCNFSNFIFNTDSNWFFFYILLLDSSGLLILLVIITILFSLCILQCYNALWFNWCKFFFHNVSKYILQFIYRILVYFKLL